MKNLMDVYLSFTERKIKKYMKLIFNQYYDENIVNEYLRTYINARYYNITHSKVVSRAFFKRILNELEYKKEILERKLQKEEIKADEINDDSLGAEFFDINSLSKNNLSLIAILELEKLGYKLK